MHGNYTSVQKEWEPRTKYQVEAITTFSTKKKQFAFFQELK